MRVDPVGGKEPLRLLQSLLLYAMRKERNVNFSIFICPVIDVVKLFLPRRQCRGRLIEFNRDCGSIILSQLSHWICVCQLLL